MINKDNEEEKGTPESQETGCLDVANMDVQCHILIKDKDTGDVLVNKRG